MSVELKLCVFDCDGTLVDSQGSIVQAMTAAFERFVLEPPSAAAVRGVVGLPLKTAIAILSPELSDKHHDDLTEAYKQAFSQARRAGHVSEPLFPGILEALDRLDSAGWLLGVATGKSRRGLLATLNGHGLLDRFVTLQTADDAPGKPNPHMLQQAMNQAGVEVHQTVMIGDTTFDVEMARHAGCAAIGVSWGYHPPEQLIAAGAWQVVDEGHALADVVSAALEIGNDA